jgi:hypothetical protein
VATTPRRASASDFDIRAGSREARHVDNPNPMAIDDTIPVCDRQVRLDL